MKAVTEKTKKEVDSQRDLIVCRGEEMHNEFKEKMVQMTRSIEEATSKMKEEIDAKLNTDINAKLNSSGPMNKIAALVAICGAVYYMYWKHL